MNVSGFMLSASFAALTSAIAYYVTNLVPEPYMDEIFHIPQAQRYCQGKFLEWDDKITTLPGLYLISIGILNPLSKWAGRLVCDPLHLRSINVALISLTLPLIMRLMTQIHGGKHYFDPMKSTMSALNIACFPLLYFFSFVYYTDVGSTFMVLLMYSLHLDNKNWLASFLGLLAVTFRQTNIVWVFFIACQAVGPVAVHHAHEALKANNVKPIKFSLTTVGQIEELLHGLLLLLKSPTGLAVMVWQVLVVSLGYILVAAAFMAFVILNDGIVVGDKTAHTVVMHPTQVAYFSAFCLAMSAPYCLSRIGPFLQMARRHYIYLSVIIVLTVGLVKSYTIAHPYLLADNRHYTFYIWRKIITRTEWSPMALVPVYIFGGFCILYSIRRTELAFRLCFPLCVVINLTPQFLLEFRYFVIPYLLYRLQVRPLCWWRLSAELTMFIVINFATLYLFLFRTFRWPHEPEAVQRFMW